MEASGEGSGFSSERKQQSGIGETREHQSQIKFPHAEFALKTFEKVFGNNYEKAHKLRQTLDVFFRQEMDNTEIFEDENGAQFPYTRINVTAFARELLGIQPQTTETDQAKVPAHRRIFAFPSFPQLNNGHQFTFVEYAMKHAMKALPGVIDDLQQGRVPPDIEIYTLGSPVNRKWGNVTPQYVQMLQRDPYKTLSETYGKLVEKSLPADRAERAKTSVLLIGFSMASSMAYGVAEKLIRDDVGAQDYDRHKDGLANVQVLLNAPVTLNQDWLRRWKIKIGFGLDVAISTFSSHLRGGALAEGGFLKKVEQELRARGIQTHEGKEEIELKRRGHKAAMEGMYAEKVPVDADKVKVNILRGKYDMTIPPFFTARAWARQLPNLFHRRPLYSAKGSQLDIVNSNGANAKVFAIRGTHNASVLFRRREMRNWGKAVDKLMAVDKAKPEGGAGQLGRV